MYPHVTLYTRYGVTVGATIKGAVFRLLKVTYHDEKKYIKVIVFPLLCFLFLQHTIKILELLSLRVIPYFDV
jgi:hypothetical protein